MIRKERERESVRGKFVFPVRRFSLYFLLWFWCGLVEGAKEPREGDTTSSFFGETCCSLSSCGYDTRIDPGIDPTILYERRDLESVYRPLFLVPWDSLSSAGYRLIIKKIEETGNRREKNYYQYRKMRLLFSFSFFSSSKRCFPLYPFYPTFDIRNITPPTFEYIHLK